MWAALKTLEISNSKVAPPHLKIDLPMSDSRVVNYNHSAFILKTSQSRSKTIAQVKLFLKNGPTPDAFSFIFVFSNILQFLQQICMWKNRMPIQYMVPGFEPLDQGSHPQVKLSKEANSRCGTTGRTVACSTRWHMGSNPVISNLYYVKGTEKVDQYSLLQFEAINTVHRVT